MFPLKCLIRNDFVYFDICLVVEYFKIVILDISRVYMFGMGTVNKIMVGGGLPWIYTARQITKYIYGIYFYLNLNLALASEVFHLFFLFF